MKFALVVAQSEQALDSATLQQLLGYILVHVNIVLMLGCMAAQLEPPTLERIPPPHHPELSWLVLRF